MICHFDEGKGYEVAFLTQVRSNGKQYVYLAEYCGQQKHSTRREKRIYSFGSIDEALYSMYYWRMAYETFPMELKDMGYEKKDLDEWIGTLESGVSKTGRSKKFKVI